MDCGPVLLPTLRDFVVKATEEMEQHVDDFDGELTH